MILFASISDRLANLGPFVQDNWPLLLPVVLGFIGIYLLLPRVRRSLTVVGALCAALALLLGGWYTVHLEVVLPEKLLFYAFAGVAITGGTLLITLKNPVYAALSFALVVLSTCGLFLLQAAPFLMAATVIIYAGAIVVTFLFVIMLAQQAGIAGADQRSREPLLACLAGFILMGALLCVLDKNYNTRDLDTLLDQVRQVAVAKTASDVIAVLGDPDEQPHDKRTLALVDGLSKYFPGENAVANLEVAWQEVRKPNQFLLLQASARRILALAPERRQTQGSLTPAPGLPLSLLSGTPADAPPNPLPAGNVAALGKSLFTDYLVPVELAGMLLLVATIGAIAIAGRRAEGLR